VPLVPVFDRQLTGDIKQQRAYPRFSAFCSQRNRVCLWRVADPSRCAQEAQIKGGPLPQGEKSIITKRRYIEPVYFVFRWFKLVVRFGGEGYRSIRPFRQEKAPPPHSRNVDRAKRPTITAVASPRIDPMRFQRTIKWQWHCAQSRGLPATYRHGRGEK